MKDKYERGRLNIFGDSSRDIKPRWIYTCNCGWLDISHSDDTTKRPYVGAGNLWSQILHETGKKSSYDDGYKIIYAQDANIKKLINIGGAGTYFVKCGLSREQKESVALGIFLEVSYRFERMQGLAFWSDSSFSQEDLISNIFGFYSTVRPQPNYWDECKPVSQEAAFEIYKDIVDTHGSMGAVKNKDHLKPILYPCSECDECKKQFPSILQKITPARNEILRSSVAPKEIRLYRDWKLYDEMDSR